MSSAWLELARRSRSSSQGVKVPFLAYQKYVGLSHEEIKTKKPVDSNKCSPIQRVREIPLLRKLVECLQQQYVHRLLHGIEAEVMGLLTEQTVKWKQIIVRLINSTT